MSSFLTSITASVNEESRVEKLKLLQHTVAILCDQSDSTPDIPGKILLPGPRKWTKVTRPSLAVGERCGLGTRLYFTLSYPLSVSCSCLQGTNDAHASNHRTCTRNLLFCIRNLRIPVDYRHFYGVFSRACHVTLYYMDWQHVRIL